MLEKLARLGYASKALIYAIIGVLAILAAANRGGRVTDTSGALRVVLTQPFGRILLLVLAAGLCGYALWRLLDAIKDPDRHGTAFKGLVTRIGNAIRGLIYGALGIEAFKLFRGLGDPTRLSIVRSLAGGERRVTDLVAELGTSQPNVSGHLACLRECGLVLDRPEGRAVWYRLAVPELFDVLLATEGLLGQVGHHIELCPNAFRRGARR